jgi:hypothetical protein
MPESSHVPLGYVALGVVALEHATTVDALAHQLGSKVVVVRDGIRCCDAAVAQALYDDREARLAAAAERRRSAPPDPTHARVKALQSRAETLRAAGKLDSDMTAFEAMASADKQAELDGTPSRRLDAYLSGVSSGYRFQRRHEEE